MLSPEEIAKAFEFLKLETEEKRKAYLYSAPEGKQESYTITHIGGSNVTHSLTEEIIDAKLE